MTTLTVSIPRAGLLNANDRPGHWGVRYNRSLTLRGLGWAIARGQAYGIRHERCTLTVTITYPPLARRRDAANLAPTVKALLDGIVDAGLLPDDNDQVIIATTYQASADKGAPGVWRFELEFTVVTP